MKSLKIAILLILFSTLLLTPAFASPILQISVDANLFPTSQLVKRKTKIVFAPIKRRIVLNSDINKYAQEISYFFSHKNLGANPISYVLFENGQIINVNKDWQMTSATSNLGSEVMLVALVYDNVFDLNNFNTCIQQLKNEILADSSSQLEISKPDDSISLRTFKITTAVDKISVDYSDVDTLSSKIIATLGDLTPKSPFAPDVTINSFGDYKDNTPNVVYRANIAIKNNSASNLVFSDNARFSIKTESESAIFVSGDWASPKVLLSLNNGFIAAGETRTFPFVFRTPLLPGDFSETFNLDLGGKIISTKKFTSNVLDLGQKVLKIKQSSSGFYDVKKTGEDKGEIAGRAPSGFQYLISNKSNGYYKIIYNNTDAWISEKYVDVIKAN